MSALLNTFLDHVAYYLNGPAFLTLLLGTGLFFTLYLRIPQVRYFRRAFRILLGKEKSTSSANGTSVFQALATSLASSIGAGSIAGVALAIHIGGPSSIFWMWVNAFFAMATRMAETAASHRYREQGQDGTMVGGPMYFMKKGLGKPWLGVIFAVGTLLTSFFAGNLPQVNGMTKMLHAQWGLSKAWVGLGITLLVAIVVLGGIKRIGQVTERLVPFMTFVYLGLVAFIVGRSYDQIIPALRAMFCQPFGAAPAVGGFLGARFAQTMQQGINFGFFTNDAGTGSAPIAHCASQENVTGKVAIMSMIEPFISTCIMCTLTALAIVTTQSFGTKVMHDFDQIDVQVVVCHPQDAASLGPHVTGAQPLPLFSGNLAVEDGRIQDPAIALVHDRSVAEAVVVTQAGKPFSGFLAVHQGRLVNVSNDMVIRGKSILKDADLALYTFGNNPWSDFTTFLMILCFLLFAFSTVISYSYFGGRALAYLGGEPYVPMYRLLFVMAVFLGSVLEATLVWKAAMLSCAMMALTNLIGIVMMHKTIKASVEEAS